jgi:asparagine synthase (glutamine-hydrolysing)
MCGIAGVFAADRDAVVDERLVASMGDALTHRGPDGAGTRVAGGYGLAHRRLAIVDIDGGHQPMSDRSGALWVVFNGEIYNFLELRRELADRGYEFTTRSDTEVLLYGYREWGERLPEKLRGMFAFAIVDETEHVLFAARDRVGKKPFYYTTIGGRFVFGSEVKALMRHPGFDRRIDPIAVPQFLCLRYVPDPRTVFSAVQKLPPGHSITVRGGRGVLRRYWRIALGEQFRRPLSEHAEEVLERLDDAVRVRLMGEVPLGAFLSGGIDSFAVVESMSRVSTGDVVCCTMGFEQGEDERIHARAAAKACGAILHESSIGASDMLEQGWFEEVFDEPFADSSAVPTYHVSRLARRHVTVALSGDGGDESFAGYRRYKYDWIENRIRGCLPGILWRGLGGLYPKLDFLPRWMRFKRTLQNLGRDPAEAYARSVSAAVPEEVMPLLRPEYRSDAQTPLQPVIEAYRTADANDPLSRAVAADFETWLPGDILVKVDRASMAVSLEVRAPFLDHLLIEAAARIPSGTKLMGSETKGFLRRALEPRLGKAAVDRRKQGFTVPARQWFVGSLGDALERALRCEQLDGVLDTGRVGALLAQHRAGLRDHSSFLWSALSLHRFQRRWLA